MTQRAVWTIRGEEFPAPVELPIYKLQEVQRYLGRPIFSMDLNDMLDVDVMAANIFLAIREKYPERTEAEVGEFVGSLRLGTDESVRLVEMDDAEDPPTLSGGTTGGQGSSPEGTIGRPSLATPSGTSLTT